MSCTSSINLILYSVIFQHQRKRERERDIGGGERERVKEEGNERERAIRRVYMTFINIIANVYHTS